MPLPQDDRRRLYAAFNPNRPADADYVDVNATRGGGFQRLEQALTLSAGADVEPALFLVTGLAGAGKTSELLRMGKALDQLGYLVVFAEAEQALDLSQPIDVPDVLLAALFAAEAKVLELEGSDPSAALQQGIFGRLVQWIRNTDVDLEKVDFGLDASPGIFKASAKASFSLKARPGLHKALHDFAGRHLSRFLEEIRGAFEALNERARVHHRFGLALIVDSLEKLRGTTSTWQSVLDSAERLFSHGAPYLRLPIPAVYTVPPALARRVPGVRMLPMIKVHDRKRRPHADGVRAIVDLVEKRATADDLAALFGAATWRARLEEIAKESGGYPREVVRLMQSLVVEAAGGPLGEAAVHHTLMRAGSAYREMIDGAGAREWAAKVAATQAVETLTDAEQVIADRLMTNNVLLKYVNDEDWWDLHPAVWSMPTIADAIAGKPHPTPAAASGAEPPKRGT